MYKADGFQWTNATRKQSLVNTYEHINIRNRQNTESRKFCRPGLKWQSSRTKDCKNREQNSWRLKYTKVEWRELKPLNNKLNGKFISIMNVRNTLMNTNITHTLYACFLSEHCHCEWTEGGHMQKREREIIGWTDWSNRSVAKKRRWKFAQAR